jgi:hypothetical protein
MRHRQLSLDIPAEMDREETIEGKDIIDARGIRP